ncbi:MAG: hypothetical protein KJZ93_07995 [Caldilineaceae bacterium]|nr:hypothetical protein [Caldilineaceae bacterium]
MSSSFGHAAFRLGFFIVFVTGALLLFLERGTAEWAITVFTFLLALLFLVIVAVIVRLGQRRS